MDNELNESFFINENNGFCGADDLKICFLMLFCATNFEKSTVVLIAAILGNLPFPL